MDFIDDELKEINSRSIEDFYREIKVKKSNGKYGKHTLFDYQAIYDDPAPIFIVISERGAKGKSTQAKKLMKDLWNDHRLRSMWLMNTQKQIDKEKKSHLTKPKQLLDCYDGSESISGDFLYVTDWDKVEPDFDNEEKDGKKKAPPQEWYAKFTALSTAENEKGSRDDYALLIYDEINVGLTNIRNKQTELVSSLLGTLSDPVNVGDNVFKKFVLHCNFKSLNNQLIRSFGVNAIHDEVTDIYKNGQLMLRVLCPKFDDDYKQKFIDDNKDNWHFNVQDMLGQADHTYFNENLHDIVNNVNEDYKKLDYGENYFLKIGKFDYFHFRVVETDEHGAIVYFCDEDINDPDFADVPITTFTKKSSEENNILTKQLQKNFFDLLSSNGIWFENSYVRENVIEELQK